MYFSVSRISGILRHLVSGDNGFEDRAEIDIPDRAIPTDEVVVHVVFALTDTIGGLEIGQGIMNAVAGCFISFDKLDFIAPQQRSVEEDRVVRVKDSNVHFTPAFQHLHGYVRQQPRGYRPRTHAADPANPTPFRGVPLPGLRCSHAAW